jgi:hypothetical protein
MYMLYNDFVGFMYEDLKKIKVDALAIFLNLGY